MKPKSLKEIIDSISGLLTGVISSFALYVADKINAVSNYRELIPTAVGVIVLIIGLIAMAVNKNKIDSKEQKKTIEYKNEIKEKMESYSKIIKNEKEDSAYRKAAEEHLVSLLNKDMDLINEMEAERASLKHDSQESDSILMSYMEKLKNTIGKQEK